METPSKDRQAVTDVALEDPGQEQQMREEIGKAFVEVIGSIRVDDVTAVTCGPRMRRLIGAAANLSTWLRTPVVRNRYDKTIEYKRLREGGPRMAKALLRLGKALAAVRGQDEIDDDVGELLTKIALDSVPPKRVAAVQFLSRQDGWVRGRTVALGIDTPTTTTTLLLEDLNALDAVDKRIEGQEEGDDESKRPTYEWRLRATIADLAHQVLEAEPHE